MPVYANISYTYEMELFASITVVPIDICVPEGAINSVAPI
jgi:hypothetical protein